MFIVAGNRWGQALMEYFLTGSRDHKGWEPLLLTHRCFHVDFMQLDFNI